MLNRGNFDGFLKDQREEDKPSLIMFHVSWCKVCQKLFPLFAVASSVIHDRMLGMAVAHVDCEMDKPLCQRYGIQGYPTFMLFAPEVDAVPRKYRGLRNKDGFVKYAERMTQPPVLRAHDRDSFEAKATNESLATFAVLLPAGGTLPASLLSTASAWMDRHRFVAGPSLASLLPESLLNVPPAATLAAVSHSGQQWDGKRGKGKALPAAAYYTGSLEDKGALTEWLGRNRFPGIWDLRDDNFFEFTRAERPTAIIAMDPSQLQRKDEETVRDAAQDLGHAYIFGVVNGTEFADELSGFGLLKQDLPRVLVTEQDLDVWVEDIEFLSFKKLKADLRALHAGAPLLRQGYTSSAKLWYWKRQAYRKALEVGAFAASGPTGAMLVAAGVVGTIFVLYMAWGFLCMLLGVLFEGPELPEPSRPTKKRD